MALAIGSDKANRILESILWIGDLRGRHAFKIDHIFHGLSLRFVRVHFISRLGPAKRDFCTQLPLLLLSVGPVSAQAARKDHHIHQLVRYSTPYWLLIRLCRIESSPQTNFMDRWNRNSVEFRSELVKESLNNVKNLRTSWSVQSWGRWQRWIGIGRRIGILCLMLNRDWMRAMDTQRDQWRRRLCRCPSRRVVGIHSTVKYTSKRERVPTIPPLITKFGR